MKRGQLVIAGSSHPGVGRLLEAASRFGRPFALIGGLYGFSDFDLIKGLDIVCPTHCTQYKSMIRSLFPEKYVEGGVAQSIPLTVSASSSSRYICDKLAWR